MITVTPRSDHLATKFDAENGGKWGNNGFFEAKSGGGEVWKSLKLPFFSVKTVGGGFDSPSFAVQILHGFSAFWC